MSISALIIARNEEDKIENSLRSLKFASEIVVVLDRSTDKTKIICKKYTNRLFITKIYCKNTKMFLRS